MRFWVCLSLLILVPEHSVAGCIELIRFSIEDQFKQKHTEQEILGAPVLLIWADRKGNEYTDAWALALQDAFEGREIQHRAVAHVEGVPGPSRWCRESPRGGPSGARVRRSPTAPV